MANEESYLFGGKAFVKLSVSIGITVLLAFSFSRSNSLLGGLDVGNAHKFRSAIVAKVFKPSANESLNISVPLAVPAPELRVKESKATFQLPDPIDFHNQSQSDVFPINETAEVAIPLANTTNTNAPLGTKDNPMTIVIYLSGEMGNHLSKITFGFGLKWMLQEDFGVYAECILRHQKYSKWGMVQQNMHRCFPQLRNISFETANTPEFDDRLKQQKEWLDEKDDMFHFKHGEDCFTEDCIQERLQEIKQYLSGAQSTNRPAVQDSNATITLPFMTSDLFGGFSYFNDRFIDRLRDFFVYDDSDEYCCGVRAEPDETLFHLRNFLAEMPKKGRRFGFEELSPSKIANELFAHLGKGDKFAFTSRFPPEFTRNYTEALENRGIRYRVIEGQNNMQDFCFLLSGRKEFGGYTMSSFAVWAAYLGNTTINRLYSIKSPDRVRRMGDSYYMHYNWTNSNLKETVQFPLYNSEEQDAVDRGEIEGPN